MKLLERLRSVRSAAQPPAPFSVSLGPLRLSAAELISLLMVVLLIAGTVLFHLLKVQPLNEQLESLRRREGELRARLEKKSSDEKRREDQATNSDRILQSLHQFENLLQMEDQGIASIINEMDATGKTNKVLVGDASYRVSYASPIVDSNGRPIPDVVSGEKNENIYPGMAIDTTIIGDYPNLRRFIASLERSRQFLIINSLAFQGEADKVRRETAKVGSNVQLELSAPDSVPVSLKLELDAYFRRPQKRQ